jgi:hypothetical protein
MAESMPFPEVTSSKKWMAVGAGKTEFWIALLQGWARYTHHPRASR